MIKILRVGAKVMNAYKEIELGLEALLYIRDCLECGKSLATHLLRRDLASGRILTKLPSNVNEREAKDFESGGKLPSLVLRANDLNLEPVPNTDPLLGGEIRTFLDGGKQRICIFEDALAEPDDPFLKSIDTRFLTFARSVYHVICPDDRNDQILKTISRAHSWLFIGVMTSGPLEWEICSRAVLTVDEIRILAENTDRIIVGAYDGESYLWEER